MVRPGVRADGDVSGNPLPARYIAFRSYADPAGHSNGSPDITGVTVADGKGVVTFTVVTERRMDLMGVLSNPPETFTSLLMAGLQRLGANVGVHERRREP